MTSPTKNKIVSKDNSDMIKLRELNEGLYQNLQSCLAFLPMADIKKFVDNPDNIAILLLSRGVIDDIEKILLTQKAQKIQASLYQWQTELIFHWNRLIVQLKNQPYSVIIKFLHRNFAVDLMHPIIITPRKKTRLQDREKEISSRNEPDDLYPPPAELAHYKSTVARKLKFDFNDCAKLEPDTETIADMSNVTPGIKMH